MISPNTLFTWEGGPVSDGATDELFEIRIRGSECAVSCGKGEKVLSVLERVFRMPDCPSVRIGCRNGGCGVCRVRVFSGDYVTTKMSRDHVSKEEEAEGYALACRLYPKSDLVIEPAFVSPKERRQRRLTEET